jgi:hypothetical protein
MSVQFICNNQEFQDTLKRYLVVTSRTLPEALNEKMFFIARAASRRTEKTEKARIENELSVIGYELLYNKKKTRLLRSKKTGRVRTGAAVLGGTLVYQIINARRTFAGKPGLNRTDMKDRVRKFLAARFRAVGTLKAGWWGALNALGKAVGKEAAFERSSNRIKNPSKATVAKPGWKPNAGIEYNLLAKDARYQRGIDKRVVEALSGAWFEEMRSTQKYIEDKLAGKLKDVDKSVRGGTSIEAMLKTARDSIK